ncbi:MAG: response regulator [Clostridiaceae bacterium]
MKILFVEDELSKEKMISEHLSIFKKNLQIEIEKSLMSGIRRIQNENFDIILLDMSLPLYDLSGDADEINEFEAFAGIDLLEELSRIRFEGKVIVITAFDIIKDDEKRLSLQQLDEQMRRDYSSIYVGSIHYNSSSLEWRNELDKMLLGVIDN